MERKQNMAEHKKTAGQGTLETVGSWEETAGAGQPRQQQRSQKKKKPSSTPSWWKTRGCRLAGRLMLERCWNEGGSRDLPDSQDDDGEPLLGGGPGWLHPKLYTVTPKIHILMFPHDTHTTVPSPDDGWTGGPQPWLCKWAGLWGSPSWRPAGTMGGRSPPPTKILQPNWGRLLWPITQIT